MRGSPNLRGSSHMQVDQVATCSGHTIARSQIWALENAIFSVTHVGEFGV